jgi:hypothetical protein
MTANRGISALMHFPTFQEICSGCCTVAAHGLCSKPCVLMFRVCSDRAPLSHPAYLDGFVLLNDHGNRALATRELKHTFVGIEVPFHVVLHEVHPAPLQILAGRGTVRTARSGIEFHRFSQYRLPTFDPLVRNLTSIALRSVIAADVDDDNILGAKRWRDDVPFRKTSANP